MRAVILAAGQGTRLRPLTDDRPKCLVELGGVALLDRQVAVLRAAGIEEIVLVGGYRAEMLEGRGCRVLRNSDHDSTNMVFTLFCAREVMRGDTDLVVSYGDIVYEPRVLSALLASAAPVSVAVDRQWRRYWALRMADPLADAETLKLDPSGRITELGKKPSSLEEIEGQYMGLFKVRADRVEALAATYAEMDREATYDGKDFRNMYMTSFLQYLIDRGWIVQSVPVDGGWLETDTRADLDLYEDLLRRGRLDELCRFEGS